MIDVHLELGQLWQCPVEWCAVWKGSVSDCLGHLQDKHGGSQYVDLWMTAFRPDVSGIAVNARLFHKAGCRLLHKYRVYKDPFPHPALQGGVFPWLPGYGHLHISIPASGAPPGQVPE